MKKEVDPRQRVVFKRPSPTMSPEEAMDILTRYNAGEDIEEEKVNEAMLVGLKRRNELAAESAK